MPSSLAPAAAAGAPDSILQQHRDTSAGVGFVRRSTFRYLTVERADADVEAFGLFLAASVVQDWIDAGEASDGLIVRFALFAQNRMVLGSPVVKMLAAWGSRRHDDGRRRQGSRRIRLMYDFSTPSAVGLRFCRERGFASVGSHDPLVATPVLESDRDAVDEDGRRLLLGHGQEDHSDERDDAGRLR